MATLQGARVLVIDDDALVRQALSRQLRKLGCVPELASCGRDGIALIASQQFDAAIVDLNMPEMNGAETVDQIRQISTLPVIIISAAMNLRSSALDSVARLPKPFAIHELQAALEAALVVRRTGS